MDITGMTLMQLLLLLLVAGVCGSVGRAIAGYSHGGCLVSVAVGFIGALVGSWIATKLALPEILAISVGGSRFPIVWSILRPAIFVALIGLLTRRRD